MKFGYFLVFCVVRTASATSHPEALNLLLADKESQINDLAAKALDAYETGCAGAPNVSRRVTCAKHINTHMHRTRGPSQRLHPPCVCRYITCWCQRHQSIRSKSWFFWGVKRSYRSYTNTCHVDMDVVIAGERTCCTYAGVYRR